MSDLIERQAAINFKVSHGIDECGVLYVPYGEVKKYLEQLPFAQPEIIRCKECKHFHYDMPYVIQGVPVLGHEVCDAWGDGCKADENGYCFLAERRVDG